MKNYLNEVTDYASLIVDLKRTIEEQKKTIQDLELQIEIQSSMQVPIGVALQVAQLTNQIESYKKYVTQAVIDKVEQKNKPTRGSISKTIDTTKVTTRLEQKPIPKTRNSISKTLKNNK